jgi:hypothetical protein
MRVEKRSRQSLFPRVKRSILDKLGDARLGKHVILYLIELLSTYEAPFIHL